MNRAWNDFHAANGGQPQAKWKLGANAMDAVPVVLRAFYREQFAEVLRQHRPWEHVYECSSPGAVRQFHMMAFPLTGRQGLLIIHSLQYEAPRNATSDQAPRFYAGDDGRIWQCSHCRRVREPADERRWDWVPSLVRATHQAAAQTLCPPCRAYYYGDEASAAGLPQALTTIEAPSTIAQAVLKQLLADPAKARGEITRDFLRSRSEAFYSGFAGWRVK
jgi:hypothetical protein